MMFQLAPIAWPNWQQIYIYKGCAAGSASVPITGRSRYLYCDTEDESDVYCEKSKCRSLILSIEIEIEVEMTQLRQCTWEQTYDIVVAIWPSFTCTLQLPLLLTYLNLGTPTHTVYTSCQLGHSCVRSGALIYVLWIINVYRHEKGMAVFIRMRRYFWEIWRLITHCFGFINSCTVQYGSISHCEIMCSLSGDD